MRDNPNYIAALNVLSHLVLTKPQVAQKFLLNHQVAVNRTSTPKQLLDTMIDLIAENDPIVMEDLASLFASHLTFKGQELLALGGKTPSTDEDQFLGGALTAATGLVKGISGLFGGKKKRRAEEAARKRQAQAQAAAAQKEKLKREAEARMQALQLKQQQLQENRRREEAERRRQDQLNRERKEDKESKASQQKMMMLGAGGLVVLVAVVLLVKNRPRYPQSSRYNPPVYA